MSIAIANWWWAGRAWMPSPPSLDISQQNHSQKRTVECPFAQWLLCLWLLLSLTGCHIAQSPFARTAQHAASTFAAAALTLNYLHHRKLLIPYARSSFESYRSELDGLNQQLLTQDGRPDSQTLKKLLAVSQPALQAVESPCLETSCDWMAQVDALQRASQALLKVGSL